MTTQRRMTQQSVRQLRSAKDISVAYLADSQGYRIHIDDALVCSSDGPMLYSTPTAAMRSIRRLRPDLSDSDIPVTLHTDADHKPRLADPSGEMMQQLRLSLEVAQKLFDGLNDDPATCYTRHAFYARSLLGRLMTMEMEMIQLSLLAFPDEHESFSS